MGRVATVITGPLDGPDFLFGGDYSAVERGPLASDLGRAVNECFASPEPGCLCTPNVAQVGGPTVHAGSVDDPVDLAAPALGEDAHGDRSAPAPPPQTLDDFISTFKKQLEQPIILSPPRLRKTRTPRHVDDDGFVPKRSVRLAKKSAHREPKPEAQARKVMLKRIGLEVDTVRPDEATFDEFQTVFANPLSESTREAMDVLFPGRKQRAARIACSAEV
jgi:hypothetical protein